MSESEETVFPQEAQTRPDTPSTLPPPPVTTVAHPLPHEELEVRTVEVPGSAPGKWVPCEPDEPGAFVNGDHLAGGAPGSPHVRWAQQGSAKTFSTRVHKLPPGAVVDHVTWRFGRIRQGEGIPHWVQVGDELIIRPSLDEHDLDVVAHLVGEKSDG